MCTMYLFNWSRLYPTFQYIYQELTLTWGLDYILSYH